MLRLWLVLCVLLSCVSRVHAGACSARAACQGKAGHDAVQLRNGSVFCGTVVFKDDGHSILVIDDEHHSRSITWDDIACLDQNAPDVEPASKPTAAASMPAVRAVAAPAALKSPEAEPAAPAPAASAAAQVVPEAASYRPAPADPEDDVLAYEEPGERRFWLEWDVRAAATSIWKRYSERNNSAWSWGMCGGIGFGATAHYALGMSGGMGPLYWSDLELGLAGTVTYGTWHQINAGDATMIEQDVSLRVGTRFRLGGPTSGIIAGISWLPTYVDFFGRQIKTPGTINPLGVRLTFDLGDGSGSYRHATVFRMALAFLPYVGRLPSMFVVSAGIALD